MNIQCLSGHIFIYLQLFLYNIIQGTTVQLWMQVCLAPLIFQKSHQVVMRMSWTQILLHQLPQNKGNPEISKEREETGQQGDVLVLVGEVEPGVPMAEVESEVELEEFLPLVMLVCLIHQKAMIILTLQTIFQPSDPIVNLVYT